MILVYSCARFVMRYLFNNMLSVRDVEESSVKRITNKFYPQLTHVPIVKIVLLWKKSNHIYSMQTYFRTSCLNANFVINNCQVLKIIKIKWWKVKVKTVFWKNNKHKIEKNTQNRNFQTILTIIIRKKSLILQFYMILKYNIKKEKKKLFLTWFRTFNLIRLINE